MKKIIALLLALVMVIGMTACAGNSKGSVYWLNFKPESDETLQEIAKMYTDETGVEVKVVTAASGTYNETLTAQMDKSEAPTLFVVGNQAAVSQWGDYCLDLTGTDIANELSTDAYMLKDANGKLCSIGYCYECFGIIVNTELLEKAGHKLSDIKDFASLKAIAEDIHKNADKLGFDAFTSSGMDDSSSWRFSGHLLTVPLHYEFAEDGITEQPATIKGTYLNAYKNIWDLYVNNSTWEGDLSTITGDHSQAQFGTGQAVFWQQGTWEYANLVDADKYGMDPANLAMIPIYCGVEGEDKAGLCCGTENCWAVNAKAPQEDIDATLAFMKWVVTSESGTKMMAEQFGPIPFKNAAESANVFFNDANEYMASGNYTVTWAFNHTPNVDNWRAGIVSALAAYSADQTADNWQKVVDAYVTGWAIEYNTQNGQ